MVSNKKGDKERGLLEMQTKKTQQGLVLKATAQSNMKLKQDQGNSANFVQGNDNRTNHEYLVDGSSATLYFCKSCACFAKTNNVSLDDHILYMGNHNVVMYQVCEKDCLYPSCFYSSRCIVCPYYRRNLVFVSILDEKCYHVVM